jgi:hypothetical protein
MLRQNYRRALVAVHQRETSKLSGPIPPYLEIDVFSPLEIKKQSTCCYLVYLVTTLDDYSTCLKVAAVIGYQPDSAVGHEQKTIL